MNTYTGGTTIDGGTLALSGNGTLGAATNMLTASGGTLDLGGTTQIVGALSGTGGIITSSSLSASALKVEQSAAPRADQERYGSAHADRRQHL